MSGIKRFLENVSVHMGLGGEITPEVEEAAANLKVYLDDIPVMSARRVPPGWVGVKTPEDAIELLASGQVKLISLDHDLGFEDPRNGYAVLKWIELQVFTKFFKPPKIWLHTANSGAISHMLLAIQSIYRKANIPYTFHPVWQSDVPDSMIRVPTGDE